jgi:hypothetical protein
MPSEFRLETPAEIQRRALTSRNQAIEDFAKAHPREWFVTNEGSVHKAPGKRFSGALYERKYRTIVRDGVKLKATYLRYVGPT